MKAYLETTIFNRYFEEGREYSNETKLLFDRIAEGKIEGFISLAVLEELEMLPDFMRTQMLWLIPRYNIKTLVMREAAFELADMYVDTGIIPARFMFDGLHIATAAVYNLDCIISLNFRHINRWLTKAETEIVHRMKGLGHLFICTPGEVLYDKE
ncbi:MAG: hypothetical protein LBQ86_07990 [Holophagales bacterium]|jgi:hypothetical protein|nr:hypothetical protein [Holophagales bacterium]